MGYDSRSTDHEWGPRLLLFLSQRTTAPGPIRLVEILRHDLPREFGGSRPTSESRTRRGTALRGEGIGPVDHKVEVHTVGGFFSAWTGFDPFEEWGPGECLCVPQQRLLEVTAGRVYHDGLGELQEARARLSYYPRDVWLYLLAAQWGRVGQQEAFVGRTGEAATS
jgi:hypothetical protein